MKANTNHIRLPKVPFETIKFTPSFLNFQKVVCTIQPTHHENTNLA